MSVQAKAVCIHLGVVAGCFVVSVGVAIASCPFAGPHTGEVFRKRLGAVLVIHVFAGILALAFRRTSLVSVLILAVICLLYPGLQVGYSVRDAIYVKYYAVWDRFRDQLADPVPKSVANLRFTTDEEMLYPDFGFRFDIYPKDLREIIKSRGLKLVKPVDLACPQYYFKYPYYVPMPGPYVLYQGKDEYGDVVILKVNEAHDRAIFRFGSRICPETTNQEIVDENQEQLESMKRKWEFENNRPATRGRSTGSDKNPTSLKGDSGH